MAQDPQSKLNKILSSLSPSQLQQGIKAFDKMSKTGEVDKLKAQLNNVDTDKVMEMFNNLSTDEIKQKLGKVDLDKNSVSDIIKTANLDKIKKKR